MTIDPDMRELLDALGTMIVPRRAGRRAVWHENLHSPYYSRNRYKRVA